MTAPEVSAPLVEFFVDGTPRPKGRPRFTNGHAYTPTTTVAWENAVGWAARIAMRGQSRFTGDLAVSLEFQGAHGLADSDNLAKAVLDGMNKIVYDDDRQVTHLGVARETGRPGVRVTVFRP